MFVVHSSHFSVHTESIKSPRDQKLVRFEVFRSKFGRFVDRIWFIVAYKWLSIRKKMTDIVPATSEWCHNTEYILGRLRVRKMDRSQTLMTKESRKLLCNNLSFAVNGCRFIEQTMIVRFSMLEPSGKSRRIDAILLTHILED